MVFLRIFVIFFIILSSLPLQAMENTINQEDDPIGYIESYFNNITGLVADFTQISSDGDEVKGVFYLLRPYHLRWQYSPPSPYLIIVNRSHITYYDYELDEMTHSAVEDSLAHFLTQKNSVFFERYDCDRL